MAINGGTWLMIFLNVFVIGAILVIAILGWSYQSGLSTCENNPSKYCYHVQCPCDDSTTGPCFGFAKMSVGDNKWICMNAPQTTVDNNGKPI